MSSIINEESDYSLNLDSLTISYQLCGSYPTWSELVGNCNHLRPKHYITHPNTPPRKPSIAARLSWLRGREREPEEETNETRMNVVKRQMDAQRIPGSGLPLNASRNT